MGVLLSWENLLEAATTTFNSPSEVAGLSMRSILTPQLAEIWRTGAWNSTTIDLDVDLGSSRQLNVAAVAAPRDGVLPSTSALVQFQASNIAAPSRVNQQTNPGTVVIGSGYAAGVNATDLGAVSGPGGTTGGRRFGSSVANGANCWVSASPQLQPVVGGATYRLTCWVRSNAAAPTRGTVLTVDEYSAGIFQRRISGIPMTSNAVNSTWKQFVRTLTLLPSTTQIVVYYIEGWQTGAEIELDDTEIVRTAEFDSGAQSFSLQPWGVWGYAFPSTVTARWLRFSFTGGPSDAYLQLGRAWVGPALITNRKVAFGHAQGAADPGTATRAGISGVRVFQRGQPYRLHRYGLSLIPTAEAERIEQMALAVGSTGQVLAARNHLDLAKTGMFGCFGQGAPSIIRDTPTLWKADFSVEEDL